MAAGIITYKVVWGGYSLAAVTPQLVHAVTLNMAFEGHGGPVRIQVPLPATDYRQTVSEEMASAPGFTFQIREKNGQRWGSWETDNLTGARDIQHAFAVVTKRVEYELPDRLPVSGDPSPDLIPHLESTEMIQTDDPEIQAVARDLMARAGDDAIARTREVYGFTSEKIRNAHFKGETSAVTTLRLGEALCGGKARLFIALARASGLPTRMVGGILLKPGSKTISHVWAEVLLGDQWVPFDPVNKEWAVLPENYLVLYRGDEALFTHTKDIAFRWFFKIKKRLEPPQKAVSEFLAHPLNIFHFWSTFRQADISLELLKIILMIPLGAVVVVFFRNIIGLHTFGTFMPALMAVAFRDTGLFWGILGFLVVLVLGSAFRLVLDKLQLMHTPRLAILLTAVVFILLCMASLGVLTGYVQLAAVSLYPLAIITLTVERVSLLQIERGTMMAARVTLHTLVVAVLAYLVMSAPLLQTLFLGFPELYLVVTAMYVLLGSWTGLRLMEFFRFRTLLFRRSA